MAVLNNFHATLFISHLQHCQMQPISAVPFRHPLPKLSWGRRKSAPFFMVLERSDPARCALLSAQPGQGSEVGRVISPFPGSYSVGNCSLAPYVELQVVVRHGLRSIWGTSAMGWRSVPLSTSQVRGSLLHPSPVAYDTYPRAKCHKRQNAWLERKGIHKIHLLCSKLVDAGPNTHFRRGSHLRGASRSFEASAIRFPCPPACR